MADMKRVACNFASATKVASEGAKCYVLSFNIGNGSMRVQILGRSRGGRWVDRWESIDHLSNFRVVTIPDEHPRYRNLQNAPDRLPNGWA